MSLPNNFQIEANKLNEMAVDILSLAQKKGADAAEVDINVGHGFNVTVRMGEVDVVENNRGKELGITLYFGKRSGSVSLSDFSQSAIQLALEKASHIARFTHEDPYSGLPDAELMAHNYPDLELYHPWGLSIDDAITLAKECEARGLRQDKRIVNSEGTYVATGDRIGVYANSNKFIGIYPSSAHSVGSAFIAQEKDEMQRDSDQIASCEAINFNEAMLIAEKTAKDALKRLGAKNLSTRQCPVIFSAKIAKRLFGSFLNAINGDNLFRKSSFLLDHLGKQIFPKSISIYEDPHIKRAFGSAPFDEEGVITKSRELITEGILQGYILDSYAARKMNMQTTGNCGGTHKVFINSKMNLSFVELLKLMGNGLLITDLMGQGVNLVTGDYSRGAFGFWVENGEIQYPVESITIAGNLRDMYLGIAAIANDVDMQGTIHSGSVLIDKMMVAGV